LPPEKKGIYASLAREKERLEAARGETLPVEAALGGEVKRSRRLAFVKGSLEDVLPRCVSRVGADGATLEPLDTDAVQAFAERRSREGSRVLLVARGEYRRDAVLVDEYTSPSPSPSLGGPSTTPTPDESDSSCSRSGSINVHSPPSSLALLAAISLRDPLRPEAPEAIARCVGAGITPIVVTGDGLATAVAVARRRSARRTAARRRAWKAPSSAGGSFAPEGEEEGEAEKEE